MPKKQPLLDSSPLSCMFRYVSTSYLMEIDETHFSSNVLGLSFYIKVTQKIACCNTITDL